MSDKWIVALDQGTSSCRAFAVDMQGQIRAQKHKIFSPHRQQKGLKLRPAVPLPWRFVHNVPPWCCGVGTPVKRLPRYLRGKTDVLLSNPKQLAYHKYSFIPKQGCLIRPIFRLLKLLGAWRIFPLQNKRPMQMIYWWLRLLHT